MDDGLQARLFAGIPAEIEKLRPYIQRFEALSRRARVARIHRAYRRRRA